MERVALAVSLVVLAICGVGYGLIRSDLKQQQQRYGEQQESVEAVQARLAALDEHLTEVVATHRRDRSLVEDRIAELRGKIEDRAMGEAPKSSATGNTVAASYDGETGAPAAQARVSEERKAEFLELSDLVNSGAATTEEQARFWQLARETKVLEHLMSDLEAVVEENPSDVDSRMELADVYVAKLLTVPNGPERGVWSTKAEKQWRAVVERDETHWEANNALGVNFSYWPPFMNKTQEAIDWLEKSRTILKSEPVLDEHATTYQRLSQMYVQQGKREKAREVLEEGLRRHRADEQLEAAFNQLKAQEEK